MTRKMDAQLVHEAQRRCNGATRHAVDQIIYTLPMLIRVYNKSKGDYKAAVGKQIDDLEGNLWALAHRR